MDLIREGLGILAACGHIHHLVAGPSPPAEVFPRMVYHMDHPRGFQVLCQEDLELLGEGWFNTLDEAKQASGMGMQYRRGGIFPKKGLPVIAGDNLSRLDKLRAKGLE